MTVKVLGELVGLFLGALWLGGFLGATLSLLIGFKGATLSLLIGGIVAVGLLGLYRLVTFVVRT